MVQGTDEMFEALAHEQRRRLLFALVEDRIQSDSPLEHESLPETSQIQYRHCHLPKLEESGFINWEQELNAIRRGSEFEEIKPLLEALLASDLQIAE